MPRSTSRTSASRWPTSCSARARASASHKTAWLMDTVGNKGARVEISAIKAAVPEMAGWVIDRAIQAYGGAGVSQDTPLASLYAHARTLRIADGPDEVHRRSV